MADIWCERRGLVPYREAFELQKSLEGARQAGVVPDVLLLLEHPPVYTRGRRKEAGELPMGEEWYRAQGIDVVDTDRGGRVTYHGPGQLVGYPIFALEAEERDLHAYLRNLEEALLGVCADVGLAARRNPGWTGVWIGERKVASIGIAVRRWVTMHGFALNVATDLSRFAAINPCGLDAAVMTSLSREAGRDVTLDEVAPLVVARIGSLFGRALGR